MFQIYINITRNFIIWIFEEPSVTRKDSYYIATERGEVIGKISSINIHGGYSRWPLPRPAFYVGWPKSVCYYIGLNIPAQRVVRVLDRIVANCGYPLKMRMDNGPELVSLTLAQWTEEHGVMLEFIRPGKPTQNAFIERFNRTYRTEILDFYLFRTLNEAREITERWLAVYNSERPHESLNNLTPEEYLMMAETPEISKSAWN